MKKGLSIFFFLFILNVLKGQNTIGLPQVINYGENDFHGGTQTWDIKQDTEGRMYFANNEGLITYDGHFWKVFPQPAKTILRSIAIDNNRIYAGGQDEIGYYSPDNNGVLQYTSLKNLIPKSQDKFTEIWDIEVYNESIFFRSWEWIFEYKDQAITAYKANNGWWFLKLVGNKLIAQDIRNGLFQYINNGWEPIIIKNTNLKFQVTGILALQKDSLLISTLQNGLFTLHNGILTPKKTAIDDSFIKSNIYSLEQINDSEFVVGTYSDGCLVLNNSGEFVQQIALPERLQNNNVLCVFLDKDKNIWTGLNNGISFISYNSAIKYLRPDKKNDVSVHSCLIFNNQLYIASSDGVYSVPISGTNSDLSFVKGEFSLINNTRGQVWRLDEVNNQLLMGHHKGGFLIQNNQATQITHNIGNWLFVPTSTVYPSKNVLVGSYAALGMLEFSNNKIINHWEINGTYESRRFLVVDNNEIWSSHPYHGVEKILLAADNKSYTTELFTEKDGLPSTLRNFVFKIKNRVVFATEKGIYEFDAASKKFISSPFLFNIFGNMVLQYLNEDAGGNIWFCSGKKIGVVSFTGAAKKPVITYFPELTGKFLAGFENIYAFNNENIFIAAKNGIIHLNYKKYIANHPKVNILLTQVKTFGKTDSLIFGGYFNKHNDTAQSQNKKPIPHFPISYNSFHFEFSSPTFSLQNNIEYSYQLEGYQNTWSEWTPKPEKDYTNLPSGTYTFKVKAHDNLGNESAIISYSFVVNPVWYKTIWAYIFYFLLFLTSVYLIVKWQKRKFNRQQVKYEEEQTQLKYIHKLEVERNEKKIIELQNEQLMNEMMYKNKELADASMHLVERSDALIKIKNELQQLYKKTGGNHDIKKTIGLVNDIEKNNSNWERFAIHFNEINNDVLKKIKARFPNLTNTDLKVCAYLQLKLSSKEIAQLMNISVKGVELSRYRLRKKLQLPTEQPLNDFLNEIQQN